MKKVLHNFKYQIILIVIGVIWLFTLDQIMNLSGQVFIFPDSGNYAEAADFLYNDFKAHEFRLLGMAFITGLPYIFGGSSNDIYAFSFIVNLFCWLGTALIIFDVCKKYLSVNKSFVIASSYFLLIGPAFVIYHLLTETIFTFIITLVFWLLDKYYNKRRFSYLSLAIGILLFSILIKPGLKFFCIFIIIFFARTLYKNLNKRSSFYIYLPLLLIAFQCFKMKSQYGDFTLTYIDGVTYYNYLGSKAEAYRQHEIFDSFNNKRAYYLAAHTYSEQKAIAGNDFKDQIQNNTSNLIKAYVLNIAINSATPSIPVYFCENKNGNSNFELFKNIFLIVSKYQNRLFTVLGLLMSVLVVVKSLKKPGLFAIAALLIMYIIAVSGVACCEGDRYHLVFFPLVIILTVKLLSARANRTLIS